MPETSSVRGNIIPIFFEGVIASSLILLGKKIASIFERQASDADAIALDVLNSLKMPIIDSLIYPSIYRITSLAYHIQGTVSWHNVFEASLSSTFVRGVTMTISSYVSSYYSEESDYDHLSIISSSAFKSIAVLLPKYLLYNSMKMHLGTEAPVQLFALAITTAAISDITTKFVINLYQSNDIKINFMSAAVEGLNYGAYTAISFDTVIERYVFPIYIEFFTELTRSDSFRYYGCKLFYHEEECIYGRWNKELHDQDQAASMKLENAEIHGHSEL